MRQYDNTTPPEKLGTCILFYGVFNSGKTRSFGTCIDPIYFVVKEDKPPEDVLLGCPKKIFYFEFDDLDEEMTYLNSWVEAAKKGEFPAKTVCIDTLTFSQLRIKQWLEDDRYSARVESKESRGMIDRARLERPDWGVSNSLVIRLMGLYNRLSKMGVNVIFSATEDSFEGQIAPSIQGKEVPSLITGFFSYIGWICKPFWYDKDGKPDPAFITFAPGYHPNGLSYVNRSSSEQLMKMGPVPLHWGKIIEIIKSGQREIYEKIQKKGSNDNG